MRVSELINHLEAAKKEYGDLPLTDFGGFIRFVKLTPARDGVSYPMKRGSQNEIGIEINS